MAPKRYTDQSLMGIDLSYRDLRGVDFSRSRMDGACLRGCDLRGAIFDETDLIHVDLRNTNLQNTDFRNADLSRADLRSAKNIHLAHFENATLYEVRLPAQQANTTLKPVRRAIG